MIPITGHGDPMPTATPATRYPVVYPSPGSSLDLLLLADAWDGWHTHWVKDSPDHKPRTVVCTLPEFCLCERDPLPRKWHGYLPAVDLRTGKRVVLTSTERGVRSILALAGEDKPLAGLLVLLHRSTAHPSSSVIALPSGKVWTAAVPAPHDLTATYESLYGRPAVDSWKRRSKGKAGAA